MLVIFLLTVEQSTTAAVQGNHIVLKVFNSNTLIIETSWDKRCTSHYDYYGGGANYICLPDEPEFLSYTPGASQHQSYIYGVEYQTEGSDKGPLTLFSPLEHN